MNEEKNIGFYKAGTVITYTLQTVLNACPNLISDVVMQITLPTGLSFSGYTIPKGTMDSLLAKWSVGSLTPGQLAEADFEFTVDDDCEGPFSVVFTITSVSNCDSCFDTPILTVLFDGVSCCETFTCYASHADDSAAGASGIELGQLYYNTTIGAVVARLS